MFEQALKKERGFIIKKMEPDGACLFRAVGALYVCVCVRTCVHVCVHAVCVSVGNRQKGGGCIVNV